MKKLFLLSIITLLSFSFSLAQRGKDGAQTITLANTVVNAYTFLTANANSGSTSITVSNSNLSTNFPGNLTTGDLVMIIQVQGVTIDDTNPITSSNWGAILNYNNCGNYEFLQVESVPNATTIDFDCSLQNDYTSAGNVVVVRVPRYSSLTINNGGIITATPWNGSTGGIVAIEVNGATTINAGGSIDVSEIGFRGGQIELNSTAGGLRFTDNNPIEGAEKGEGIAGDQAFYGTSLSGRYCRGAAANGGGGGTAHNSGGAGGANAGNPANWIEGSGVPDPAFNTSWALETPSLVGVSSSGGGRGGYSHAGDDGNELTDPPGNAAAWGGDFHRQVGGLGGRPLDYTTGKIFMGGAGGAGDGETTTAGAGGNGAGLVFMSTYGNVNGSGNILANGQDGFNCEVPGAPPFNTVTGKDPAGGAGAGGTVLIKTTGTVTGITIDANGGAGGDQVLQVGAFASIGEVEGPGGGGGGGYIAITAGAPTANANGGVYGTTNSPYVTNFIPNGATSGAIGMPNENIDAFDIIVDNDTICSNTTSSLTANITGTAPVGATVEWFDAASAGTLLFTGTTFTTPSLTSNTTYYVRVCPAPYRVPVTVIVNACSGPTASFSSTDSTLCAGDCIDFSDLSTGSPTGWTWYFPGAATTTSTTQSPTNICYTANGNFDVSLVVDDGANTDSLYMPGFITVTNLPPVTANASPSTTVCTGDMVTLTGGGATSYTWTGGVTDGLAFAAGTTTNYIVTGTDANGCSDTNSVTITVNNCSVPTASFTADSMTICVGGDILFTDNSTGTGITNWDWDFDFTGLGGVVPATANTQGPHNVTFNNPGTYSINLSVTDANGTDDSTIVVTVTTCSSITAGFTSSSSTICAGDSVVFTDATTGGTPTIWQWDFDLTTVGGAAPSTAINQGPHTVFFNTPGSYTVELIVFDGTVFDTTSSTITVNDCSPTANFSASNTVLCETDCITFTDLSTGSPTAYTWSFPGGTPATANTPNPGSICYTTAGTYNVTLTVSNQYGIDSIVMTNMITVNLCTVPTAGITMDDANGEICINNCIAFTYDGGSGGTPTTLTWTFPGGTPNTFNSTDVADTINVCWNDTTGTFNVALAVSNANGSSNANTNIVVHEEPVISAGLDTSITIGTDGYLNAVVTDTSGNILTGGIFDWSPATNLTDPGAQNTTVTQPLETNSYTVTYTDTNGCIVSDNVVINVDIALNIGVPKAFSPNGDGENDFLWVRGKVVIRSMNFTIYNRYGQQVFYTTDIDQGWDGTHNGNELNPGVFVYYVNVIFIDGTTGQLKGNVTLVK